MKQAIRPIFKNRQDAGRKLARRLLPYADSSPVILALPRGGVIVAGEVARALGDPLNVVIAKKISAPGYEGLSIGALAEGGVRFIDDVAVRLLGISPQTLADLEKAAARELTRYMKRYRGNRPMVNVRNRTVILIDDGLASGHTARAAIQAISRKKPCRLILAVPVSGPDAIAAMDSHVDELVCYATPPGFLFANDWYKDFSDCKDASVHRVLKKARRLKRIPPKTAAGILTGDLEIPRQARGIILLAHGSGSHRNSPRNLLVADALLKAGFATLRIDLLTTQELKDERRTKHFRFNVGLLTERVCLATESLSKNNLTRHLRLGYFGASMGASAMLAAAAKVSRKIRAIVSRGGRPDYVPTYLPHVKAPTLLLVGGKDNPILEPNRGALKLIGSKIKKLAVVDGASHLFEEPGKMNEVARLSVAWFEKHLLSGRPVRGKLPTRRHHIQPL